MDAPWNFRSPNQTNLPPQPPLHPYFNGEYPNPHPPNPYNNHPPLTLPFPGPLAHNHPHPEYNRQFPPPPPHLSTFQYDFTPPLIGKVLPDPWHRNAVPYSTIGLRSDVGSSNEFAGEIRPTQRWDPPNANVLVDHHFVIEKHVNAYQQAGSVGYGARWEEERFYDNERMHKRVRFVPDGGLSGQRSSGDSGSNSSPLAYHQKPYFHEQHIQNFRPNPQMSLQGTQFRQPDAGIPSINRHFPSVLQDSSNYDPFSSSGFTEPVGKKIGYHDEGIRRNQGLQGNYGNLRIPPPSSSVAQEKAPQSVGGEVREILPPICSVQQPVPPPYPMELRNQPAQPVKSSGSWGFNCAPPISVVEKTTCIGHPSHQGPTFNEPVVQAGERSQEKGLRTLSEISQEKVFGAGHTLPLRKTSPEKPKMVDASHLVMQTHRALRPDHIVIILRGLPGSGKSHLAKLLRDMEVNNGGNAVRIHSIDDYFMTEVEKVDESESSNPPAKGKKKTKKVMEYCYEPEMEEVYRASMLRAFKKTVEEGTFTFVIVDDRNLRVADFAQFWAIAKRSGYEVYVHESRYRDPIGCAARNVHGCKAEDIKKMAEQWEETPLMYLLLSSEYLFHGLNLDKHDIAEVEMDMGEEELNMDDLGKGDDIDSGKNLNHDLKSGEAAVELIPSGTSVSAEDVKELGRSRWYEDGEEDDDDDDEGKLPQQVSGTALAGLLQAYGKKRKSVHWGDHANRTGFSIGMGKKSNQASLIIGPGAGYRLDTNPPTEEEKADEEAKEPMTHSIFLEHLRAERESFRAVFDRRRQRIGGFDVDDE